MRRHRRLDEGQELDITAFMNLMVILVPFLLITATFTQVSIFQLQLPASATETAAAPQEPGFRLELIVRSDSLELREDKQGYTAKFMNVGANHDIAGVTDALRKLKAENAKEKSIMVLAEPDVPYQTLIQVMDSVGGTSAGKKDGQPEELFPEISIGDAPVLARRG